MIFQEMVQLVLYVCMYIYEMYMYIYENMYIYEMNMYIYEKIFNCFSTSYHKQ